MIIFIVIASIIFLTGFVYWFDRQFKLAVCPICAGVSLTWVWILAGIYSDWLVTSSWVLAAAVLLGGSAVGIAYQAEKHYLRPGRSNLLWKTLFIPAGFALAYGLVNQEWLLAAVFLVVALAAAGFFLRFNRRQAPVESEQVKALEQKMKGCC